MSLIQSEWSETFSNGKYVIECVLSVTASETDAYTLKTPIGLDLSRPFTIFYSASATPDGSALPLDLWLGYSDDFVLSGQGGNVVATDGADFKSIMDDVVAAVTTKKYAFLIDPNQAVADVVTLAAIATGLKTRGAVASYLALNLDGASALTTGVDSTFTIVQDTGTKGIPA